MKKNNKGITLVELIISFALVAVAVIYFYQTLYTVKKLYNTAQKETQSFVDKDYALRIADAWISLNNSTKDGTIFFTDHKYTLTFVDRAAPYQVVLYKYNDSNKGIKPYYIKIYITKIIEK